MKWATKILAVLVLCMFSYGTNLQTDFAQIYLQQGEDAMVKAAEDALISKEYWSKILGENSYKYGYYQNKKNILVACKACNSLEEFVYEDGNLIKKYSFEANFGKSKGDKFFEGDLKTPIGVYEFTKKLKGQNLHPYYGHVAFVTNYPNTFDRFLNKNGYGIWLHGYPLDGNRSEPQTRGCVALENDNLEKVNNSIDYKNTILIIAENNETITNKKNVADVLHNLFLWRRAWVDGDLEKYLSFYSPEFKRFDGMNYNQFARMKKEVFGSNKFVRINIKDLEITPYPTSLKKNVYRVKFFEKYRSNIHSFSGKKEIFLQLKGDRFIILVEN